MVECRFTGVNHYHDGERLESGDIVELTEEQYENWSYQFERLDTPSEENDSEQTVADEAEESNESEDTEGTEENAEESDESEEQVAEPPIDPGEYTIQDLDDEIAESDYSDAELRAIADAEIAGEDRSGAKTVINEALEG